MNNVNGYTYRYLHVPTGHRSPRQNIDGKKDPKTTSEVIDLTINQLVVVGPTDHNLMRQEILGIDRQRYYMLFGAPRKGRLGIFTAQGHVVAINGKPMKWVAGPNIEDLKSTLKIPLEPHFRVCNTGPGLQILCPLCGDTKRVVSVESEGIPWYYEEHLKGVAHQ